MQEAIKKILCAPINWFIRNDEFHRLPVSHFIPAYIGILAVLLGSALAILCDIGLLILGCLYCSNGQWFLGLKSIFCFISVNVFVWWAFKNMQRICSFIKKANFGRKSNNDSSY